MTWKIQAISGDLTGQEISIERDMLVGRHQQADIVLQESDVSRKHAAFVLKDQALWLQDLNSSNGTFINDVRLTGESLLKEDQKKLTNLLKKLNKKIIVQKALAVGILKPEEAFEFLKQLNFVDMITVGVANQKEVESTFNILKDL